MGNCACCCFESPPDITPTSSRSDVVEDFSSKHKSNRSVKTTGTAKTRSRTDSGLRAPTLTSDSNVSDGDDSYSGPLDVFVNDYGGLPDEVLSSIEKLEKYCPLATKEERQRFLLAKGGDYDLALEQLQQYLKWREKYDLDTLLISPPTMPSHDDDEWHSCASNDETIDQLDWHYASDKALSYYNVDEKDKPTVLPQLAFMLTLPGSDEHVRDKNGNRILLLLPAQMNPNMADDETFTLCIAFYLERKLGRNTMEKMAVSIDVRGGKGWHNPKPGTLIPFIKKVTKCLERNFPERMANSIVFPMPRIASALWNFIKKFLDENTANKIAVVGGDASTNAKPPYKKMEAYVERKILERMETVRLESFTD